MGAGNFSKYHKLKIYIFSKLNHVSSVSVSVFIYLFIYLFINELL